MDIGFGEEAFDFLGEGLFENFDDILDDNELMEMVDTSVAAGGPLAPHAAAATAAAPPAFPSLVGGDGTRLTATSEENKICDEMNIPEDWFTNLLDDPNLNIDLPVSATIDTAAATDDYIIKDDSLFWSSSPISVLNHGSSGSGSGSGSGGGESGISTSSSSSSNSINNETDIVSVPPVRPNAPVIPTIPARARTKRPRPATFAPRIRLAVPDTPPVGSDTYCATPMKKKKKKKHCHPSASTSEPVPARKCMHCGIQRTPQWRLGPMGPKTLCNACGVRYKSGRLFPEYRPAASPTFVPSVHSNSHKKVVEMRLKATENETCAATTATTTKVSPAAKNCDLLLYIRNMD